MTLAAAVTTACRKEAAPESENQQVQKVNLTVRVADSMGTKATGIKGDANDEEKVNSLQVFIFNGESIDGYGSTVNATSIDIGCTAGRRDIYAVVNAPDLSSLTSRSGLLGQVSALGASISNLEMIGSKTEDLVAGMEPVTIGVDRFAARIVVKKVSNALTSPALQKQEFIIQSMHLNNVAGDIDYGLSGNHTVSTWYNKMTLHIGTESPSNMIYDAIGSGLASGASYDTDHYFYAYPNNAAFSSSLTWAPRSTMLVLKIKIGSTLYNYPIRLPALENNKSYEIEEIKITRPGNKDDGQEGGADEQEPVQGMDGSISIIVKGWTPKTVTEGTTI